MLGANIGKTQLQDRCLSIHPSGEWLVVANQSSGSLVTFNVDRTSGLLSRPPRRHVGVPAPANIYVMPLRFKLGGRLVLSAHLNVETARSERKRPEI
jgi:hypothetical protein